MANRFHLPSLLKRTHQLLQLVPALPNNQNPEKVSGYLTVRRASDGLIMTISAFGEMPPEKVAKYQEKSLEKSDRLLAHPDHISSWQSRHPEEGQWGGAIRATSADRVISFSGLPELIDEALVLVLAFVTGLINSDEFKTAVLKSNNQFAEALLAAYQAKRTK